MSKMLKIVAISIAAVLLAPVIVMALPVDEINPGVGEPGPDPWPRTGGDFIKDEPDPWPKPPPSGDGILPIAPDPGIGEGGISIPVAPDPWPKGR